MKSEWNLFFRFVVSLVCVPCPRIYSERSAGRWFRAHEDKDGMVTGGAAMSGGGGGGNEGGDGPGVVSAPR